MHSINECHCSLNAIKIIFSSPKELGYPVHFNPYSSQQELEKPVTAGVQLPIVLHLQSSREVLQHMRP